MLAVFSPKPCSTKSASIMQGAQNHIVGDQKMFGIFVRASAFPPGFLGIGQCNRLYNIVKIVHYWVYQSKHPLTTWIMCFIQFQINQNEIDNG